MARATGEITLAQCDRCKCRIVQYGDIRGMERKERCVEYPIGERVLQLCAVCAHALIAG